MTEITMIKLELAKAKKIKVRGKLDLMSIIYTFMQLFCGWNLPEKSTLVIFQNISVGIFLFSPNISFISLFGLLIYQSTILEKPRVGEIFLAAGVSLTRDVHLMST